MQVGWLIGRLAVRWVSGLVGLVEYPEIFLIPFYLQAVQIL
jgi:hypothetical protein